MAEADKLKRDMETLLESNSGGIGWMYPKAASPSVMPSGTSSGVYQN